MSTTLLARWWESSPVFSCYLRRSTKIHRTGEVMNRVLSSAVIVTSLIVTLGGAASWSQVPSTNDKTDSNTSNTGGGSVALLMVAPYSPAPGSGSFNTAYGIFALSSNTTGSVNTASG